MPKIKTKSGAKKRFKVTASGKIRRARANHNHILGYMPSKRRKRLRQMALVAASDMGHVKRMLVQ